MNTLGTPAPSPEPSRPWLARIQPVVFALLALFLVFVLYQLLAGAVTLLLFRGRVTEENVGAIRWVTVVAQLLCILVPTLVLAKVRFGPLTAGLRLRAPGVGQLAATVVAVFALQQVLQGYMLFQESIPLPETIRPYVETLKEMFEATYRILVTARSPWEFVSVVFAVAFVPAICEELLFRGLVQRNLEQAAGALPGAVVTGIIFGVYHLNPLSVVPLISLGVFFGYLVVRTGSTTLAVAAHFFNNFIACTAVFLNVNDEFIALAPSGRPPSTIVLLNMVLFGLVFVAALSFLRFLSRDHDAA